MRTRSYNYYRIRTLVRFLFWGSLTLSFVWLVNNSIRNWDNYDCQANTITAQPFDSLWSIAEKNCSGNIRKTVWDLEIKYGNNLQVGQVINLTSNS